MKHLLLTFLTVTTIATTQAQDFDLIGYIEIDAKRIKATKIKSIKEESDCYVEQENPPYKYEDCEQTYLEKYDKDGNLILLKTYDDDGELESTSTYTYKNNKIVNYTNDDGEDIETQIFTYNNTGLLSEKKEYDNKTLEEKTTYSYNTKGLLIEEIRVRPKSEGFGGSPYKKTIYKYNANGKCTHETSYNKSGYETNALMYEYNNNGLTVIEKEKYDGAFVKMYEKTTDSRGNVIESILYDFNGKQEKRMVETYDSSNNRLTYEAYDKNNMFFERITETYNAKNDPIDYTLFIPKERYNRTKDSKSVTKYWYKYDSKGNWIEKASYEEGEDYPTNHVKRTIKY